MRTNIAVKLYTSRQDFVNNVLNQYCVIYGDKEIELNAVCKLLDIKNFEFKNIFFF